MAEFEYAKDIWRRQIGSREDLPWTRGATMLEFQPAFFLIAAITGGVQGTLGGILTAVIVIAFGVAMCWIDRAQLPDRLRQPSGETAWSAIVPFAYLQRRAASLAAAGVPRPRLPLWVALIGWAVALIVWAILWGTTGTPWAFVA